MFSLCGQLKLLIEWEKSVLGLGLGKRVKEDNVVATPHDKKLIQ